VAGSTGLDDVEKKIILLLLLGIEHRPSSSLLYRLSYPGPIK
jgi:hypothetical protein